MTEKKRKFVVDGPLPIVKIGVADPTRLHGHQDLTGAGIRHLNGLNGYRFPLGSGDNSPDTVWHRMFPYLADGLWTVTGPVRHLAPCHIDTWRQRF